MKTFIKIILSLAVIAVVIAVGVIVNESKNQTVGGKQLNIGVIAQMTGESAFIGKGLQRGIDLAAEAQSVSSTTVSYADSKGTSQGMVNAYRQLTTQGNPTAIIASGNQVPSLVPLAKEDKIPLIITNSSASGLPKQGEYIFRYFTNADTDAPVMANYATKNLNHERFAVLHVNDQFGADYRDVFSKTVKKNGGEVVVSESFNYGNFDFRTQLTKIKSADFDAIYLIGLGHQLVPAVKQIKEIGIDKQILAMGTIATQELIQKMGDAANGIHVTAFCTDNLPQNYVDKFQDTYGKEPGFYSEIGYDIMTMIQQSGSKSGFSRSDLQNGLMSIQNFSANTGTVSVDKAGELIIPMCPKKITEEGRIYNLQTGQYSNY